MIRAMPESKVDRQAAVFSWASQRNLDSLIHSRHLGGLITHRMARNLLIHLSSNILGPSGACFLSVAAAHLALYYMTVMRPMCSNDPMLCSTCLEIRAFTIGSVTPVVLGTSIAVVANLSTCLLNKTIRLPEFRVQAYPEWARFFEKHAFKGMRTRHFVAFPLISGFLSSVVFLGQTYYWRTYLNQRLYDREKQTSFTSEPTTSDGKPGSLGSLLTKYFGTKTK